MADLLKKLFFDDVRKNNWPETGIVFIVFFDPLSQSIGPGRISREGALDARESRERRDKIVPKSSPEKEKKQFWPKIFQFFSAGSLVVRESRDRLNRMSDRNSQKEEICYFCV